jgi:hypothetical protein
MRGRPSRPSRDALAEGALVVLLLGLHAGLAFSSARQHSATFDEGVHLPAGYTYLATGDHRLNPEHPPLVKLLAAAPAWVTGATFKADDEAWVRARQWEFGKRFLYRWNEGSRLLLWGRLPMIGLSTMLGLVVYLWSRRLFGRGAAGVALLLCALSPDILAHGPLVTTDVPLALFLLLSVVALDFAAERTTPRGVLAVGLAAGAALATKFSGLVVLPVLVGLGAACVLLPHRFRLVAGDRERVLAERGTKAMGVILVLVAVSAVALLVLWASYGFHSALTEDSRARSSLAPRPADHGPGLGVAAARAVRTIVPEAYAFGLSFALSHSAARPSFLLGELSDRGFRSYFAATFALKTPIPLLLLLSIGVCFRGWREPWARRITAFLAIPVLLYVALVLSRSLNIGHRHLLPIYPFLFVAAGVVAARLARGSRAGLAFVVALLAWYVAGTVRVHPDELAYFNEIGGGPANGYNLLVDSNLDWGQDLPALAAWLKRSGDPRLKFSYFGSADPAYYGIDCEYLPGYMAPRPARVVRDVKPGDLLAVSATNLQGVYLDPEDRPLMDRLRKESPLARVGYSIFIYKADFAWPVP